jgi:hypothetical protein
MSGWWKGGALIAAWLSLCLAVHGSDYDGRYPVPHGPARMPEPLPCGVCDPGYHGPPLVPGPINPHAAPPGPPDCLSLPATHSSAFQCEHCLPEEHFYFHFGTQFLQRQKFSNGDIAVLDPQNTDTGEFPEGAPLLRRFKDLNPTMNPGIRGRIGYMWQNFAIEAEAFYIFQANASKDALMPGQVDTLFFNAPLGFQGNNGLFIQADRARVSLEQQLVSAEVNYRTWDIALNGVDILLGLRYVQPREKLEIAVDDDGVQFVDADGLPDPLRQATYGVQVRNNMVLAQTGFEWVNPILGPFWFGWYAKGGIGPNFISRNWTLRRGDGFVGFNVRENTTVFSGLFDTGFFLDIYLLQRMRVRGGYMALFLINVAESKEQVNFDLAFPDAIREDNGSIFYHGPMLEFQFLF